MLKKKGISQIIWFLIAFILILVILGIVVLILNQGKKFGLDALEKIFNQVIGKVNT
ncbi:MAG: hypothetical protein J7K87_03335 [Candidatus Aenigmarchaeota archaeon]|nr:hypothetical protein [Candidatus Aenigmarchaeota archaeon]